MRSRLPSLVDIPCNRHQPDITPCDQVHDEVAAHIQNSLEEVKYIDGVSSGEDSGNEEEEEKQENEEGEEKAEDSGEEIVDTFRMIGLRRKAGESLVRRV